MFLRCFRPFFIQKSTFEKKKFFEFGCRNLNMACIKVKSWNFGKLFFARDRASKILYLKSVCENPSTILDLAWDILSGSPSK